MPYQRTAAKRLQHDFFCRINQCQRANDRGTESSIYTIITTRHQVHCHFSRQYTYWTRCRLWLPHKQQQQTMILPECYTTCSASLAALAPAQKTVPTFAERRCQAKTSSSCSLSPYISVRIYSLARYSSQTMSSVRTVRDDSTDAIKLVVLHRYLHSLPSQDVTARSTKSSFSTSNGCTSSTSIR